MPNDMTTAADSPSRGPFVTGWVITVICILFLLFDSITKIIGEHHSVEGTEKLGWAAGSVQGIGILLLICTIFYIIPRTAILGAILLTAYLGGATATMVRIGVPYFFPVIFGVLVWAGVFLRYPILRRLIPFNG